MKYFICLFFIFNSISALSQPLEDKIPEVLDSFALLQPQEKAYLQTDRSSYFPGETIWFKAYSFLENKPGFLSKIFYVALFDEAGKILQKKMLPLSNSACAGDFDLPANLVAGNYFLSAYSLWMLNFPQFINTKKIRVFNPNNNPETVKLAKLNYTIKFLPEGGNLVEGLTSILAFKAEDDRQLPAKVNGRIKDYTGKIVSEFETNNNGMGAISFTPAANTTYTVEVNWPGDVTGVINFPKIHPEGITLTADNRNPSKCFVKVTRSVNNQSKFNEFLLVAQQNNKLVYMAKLNLDEGLDAAAINKKNFPPGIVQVTLFSMDGKALAERLVFIANHDIQKNITTKLDTTSRSKNKITIELPGWTNINGAVSITNSILENDKTNENIYSQLLLSSDLHGAIHDPYKYFINKEDSTIAKLDLLMLTNGWRRFNWDEIMSFNYSPIRFPFETSLYASGVVFQSNGKTPLRSGKINMIIKGEDSTSIMSEARINNQSQFIIDNLEFKKEATLFYQGTNLAKENAIVSIKLFPSYIDTVQKLNFLFPKLPVNTIPVSSQLYTIWEKLPGSYKAKTLESVVVKAKKRPIEDSLTQVYATDIFHASDQTLALNGGHYFDMWQFLQRSVPGINIQKADAGTWVTFSRFEGLNLFSEDGNTNVSFFLNEIPVSTDIIESLNPDDVALVKIYKGATAVALGADRGAIAIYTTKGKSTRDWRQKGFDYTRKTGYAVSREYYSADYSIIKLLPGITDIRNTLYWNPNIKIQDEKIEVIFYNDDVTRKFKILLEGMDKSGRLIHLEKILN